MTNQTQTTTNTNGSSTKATKSVVVKGSKKWWIVRECAPIYGG